MATPVSPPEAQEVAALIARGRATTEDLATALERAPEVRAALDRSRAMRLVVGGYVVALLAIVAYLIYRGVWCGADTFPSLIEVVKIGFLPIVTLVIGYYFGISTSR